MWHVLEADPESRLICGLDPSADADTFVAAVKSDTVADLMTSFGVQEGTTVFVPAGVVHAIGGGILLAEIQQNSDLTYRIYDWGRVEADGRPRALHLNKAREAIKFGLAFGGAVAPVTTEEDGVRCDVLCECPYFTAERLTFSGSVERVNDGASFHIILAVTGGVSLSSQGEQVNLKRGECVLVSGDTASFKLEGDSAVLDYFVR
jgi:mannose-6-phosphate isomerase